MITLTDDEYSNMVATIQFLQNKSDRLEREKKEAILLAAELSDRLKETLTMMAENIPTIEKSKELEAAQDK